MDFALSEITLVLFTTLAPSGTVAYALVAWRALACPDQGARRLVAAVAGIPLAVCLLGLIASATHLGNPANALYVFMGVGRSPLSNEVAAAVAFFAVAGVAWMYGFAERVVDWAHRAALAASMLMGIVFLATVAMAYHARTIVSWDTPFVPGVLVASAFAGGPLVAWVCVRALVRPQATLRFGHGCLAVSAAGVVVAVVLLVAQEHAVADLGNAATSMAHLAPLFGPSTLLYASCAVGGWLLMAADARGVTQAHAADSAGAGDAPPLSLLLAGVSLGLVFAGTFVMRFNFYMTHLTYGISF
ncbi:dimethyl sulfoxide reductase anchor subunit [Eggerthellaceae bacterium zg-1084]|uniref:dimethyl sulfoxide reductase anchor subunit family protein n=1 Tax=Berryella wangjianweii TaxID=2734634 RepID=UPI00155598A1|nr:DmsC/YnfH family molybdoenzyme membrane anchor subunit [Berryella wangjianweii]NPD30885.1 dimethyl sulfoxide reductase anchor subunit [Berryella wangjianweii]